MPPTLEFTGLADGGTYYIDSVKLVRRWFSRLDVYAEFSRYLLYEVQWPDPFNPPYGQLATASVIVTIPIIIIVLLFQRKIVAGLTSGAVKG